eukprot:15349172-Ditylum_brightwellii.AAC.2
MVHTCRTAFCDSISGYGGDLWTTPCQPPPQELGQGNGAAPCIWVLISNPIINALHQKGFGAAIKYCKLQEEIDLSAGLAKATGGQVSPDKGKNHWYLLEFEWDKKGKWKLGNIKADLWVSTNGGKSRTTAPQYCS